MDNQIQIFTNEQFGSVRTFIIEGAPWFVAADVCRCLEISNNRDAISRIDEDEKGVASIDTLGGKQNMTIVNEQGLYGLIFGSRKPEAKKFKRWIRHDVLPNIRQHGVYMTPDAIKNITPQLLRQMADILEKVEVLEKKNAQLEETVSMQGRQIAELQSKATGLRHMDDSNKNQGEVWTESEIAEFEKLCKPLIDYLQQNHKKCNPYSWIIIQWNGVSFIRDSAFFPVNVLD